MDEKKVKMPVGMIIILVIVGWQMLSLLLNLKIPMSQLGAILLSGSSAIIINLINFIILGAIFFGIIKRYLWARKLAIIWYIVSMLLALFNFLSFINNKTMYDEYYRKILSPEMAALMTTSAITMSLGMAVVFAWIIGIIVIIYLLKKKDFFTD